jgi:hypothetical protein
MDGHDMRADVFTFDQSHLRGTDSHPRPQLDDAAREFADNSPERTRGGPPLPRAAGKLPARIITV